MEVNFTPKPFSTKIQLASCFKEASFLWKEIKTSATSVFLLTEETTSILFAQNIIHDLQAEGISVVSLVIPGGEKIKSLSYLEIVSNFMIENNLRRDCYFIALGGGALLDLGGFLASIYLRGIPFIAIPTTLLSMVDACLGGKTAINTPQGKNTLGTFYPALYIFIALESLSSLPKKQKKSALAEIIKYALILNKELFIFLKEGKELWDKEDPIFIKKLISFSLEAKKSVIEKDPIELGLRRILNFGHTIAHSLEALWQYEILHGSAVIIGLLIESYLSFKLGFLSHQEIEDIVSLLRQYDLIEPFPYFSYLDIEPFLLKDKKNKEKNIRFVLISSIGTANDFNGKYCSSVPREALLDALDWYHSLAENFSLVKN